MMPPAAYADADADAATLFYLRHYAGFMPLHYAAFDIAAIIIFSL